MRQILIAGELAGYQPELGAALWRLEDVRDRTLKLLGDMPAEYVDLEMRGNTIGTILYHLALIEADWLYSEILEQPFPEDITALFPVEDRDQAGILALVQGQTLQDHLARLSRVRQAFLEGLRGMTSADFHRPRCLPSYDVSPAWVLHHLAQHEAEHRSELGSAIAQLKAGS
jgi:uncharacterized damage-inducible protein DinB